jgi:hypothetical protein
MLRRKQTKTTAILKLAAIKEEIKFVIASIATFNKEAEQEGLEPTEAPNNPGNEKRKVKRRSQASAQRF